MVGIDGSPASRAALEWAAGEAALRGCRLDIVHAEFARRELLVNFEVLELAETKVLESAERLARTLQPGIEVAALLYQPPAAAALLRVSAGADLLVLGCRRTNAVHDLTWGSVSGECARRAPCPVALVRTAPPGPEPPPPDRAGRR